MIYFINNCGLRLEMVSLLEFVEPWTHSSTYQFFIDAVEEKEEEEVDMYECPIYDERG